LTVIWAIFKLFLWTEFTAGPCANSTLGTVKNAAPEDVRHSGSTLANARV
jgi:hypothetical protein